ncbi:LysR family transcriptional regulator [Duganella sp. Root198D2]|uniref:LysR family transcriptional regulator n=1 Tax=Duganella sp. Root198D2 TaxID=1736489 RepID=UPI00070E9FCC|nr:LysR family transcriptional regulator [Duganella sp. Root198D2]KRC00730.1 LysR family transcriptional regulator [Duganella sp. Root198D2]
MNERLNGINVFVQAVEAGSFSAAATRLHQTRSAVAKSIARLEERLGVRLFHRTTRSQNLTEAGQSYYERCVRALAELDAGEACIGTGRSEPTGRLRISVPVLFGRQFVAPLMMDLAQRYPQLTIDISFNDRVVDLLDEGFDLGLRVGPLPNSSSLAARHLGQQRMLICAAPSYLEQHGEPKSLQEVAGHVGILYSRGRVVKEWTVSTPDGRTHDLLPRQRMLLDDLQVIADATARGMGLAWLPCWLVAPYVKRGELKVLFDCGEMEASQMHLVWPHTPYMPAKLRVAIDTLLEVTPIYLASAEQNPALPHIRQRKDKPNTRSKTPPG